MIEYSFADRGDARTISKGTRGAIRRLLRDSDFEDTARAVWEKQGNRDDLAATLKDVLDVVEGPRGRTLRHLSITLSGD